MGDGLRDVGCQVRLLLAPSLIAPGTNLSPTPPLYRQTAVAAAFEETLAQKTAIFESWEVREFDEVSQTATFPRRDHEY